MARSNQLASLAVDIVINARRFRSTTRGMRGDLKKTDDSARNLARNITRIGLAASAFLIVQRAANLAIEAIKQTTQALIDLESQLVAVEKVAGSNITKEFFGLSRAVPNASFKEISEVMAGAARSGLRGGKDIEEFSRAVLILSKTSDDIKSTDASLGLAQLLENFDLGTDKALQLANNIDVLSDRFITTSGAILTSSKRLAGFAETAGFTIDELTAVVAVLLKTGATATTIRTTFGAIFTKVIPKALETGIALGLVGDELLNFASKISRGGPEALDLFITSLNKLPESRIQEILKDLGISGARIQIVMKLLAKTLTGAFSEALEASANSINNTDAILLKFNQTVETAATTVNKLKKEQLELLAAFGTTAPFESFQKVLRGFKIFLGVGIDTKKPLNNLKDVQREIKKIKEDLTDIGAGSLREQAGAGQILGKGTIGSKIIGKVIEASAFGKAAELIDQLKRLEEIEAAIFKARQGKGGGVFGVFEKRMQDILNEIEDAKSKAQFDAQRKTNIEQILEGLPSLKTGLVAKLESLEKQRIKLQKELLAQGIEGGDPALDELRNRFFDLKFAAIDSANALKDEKQARENANFILKRQNDINKQLVKKERLKATADQALGGLLGGKFGQAFNFIENLRKRSQEIINQDRNFFFKKLSPLFDAFQAAGLKEILKDKPKTLQFKGLTQAWKDAITTVPKTQFEKIEEKFFKALIKAGAKRNLTLQEISDKMDKEELLKIGGGR